MKPKSVRAKLAAKPAGCTVELVVLPKLLTPIQVSKMLKLSIADVGLLLPQIRLIPTRAIRYDARDVSDLVAVCKEDGMEGTK